MARTPFDVSQTPAQITTLDDGADYLLQNRGPEPVFLDELAAAPARDALPKSANKIAPSNDPNEWLSIQVDAAMPPTLWTSQGQALVIFADLV